MRSPVYWHPLIYQFTMRLLYGNFFEARYRAIADLIPDGSSVVEACAGDGYLYRHYLKAKRIDYTGLDINPAFLSSARSRHIPFIYCDLAEDAVPPADYIVIHASLYQFIPQEHEILRKLLRSANQALIVAEPVRNLADSSNRLISYLAKHSADPGERHTARRFNRDTLLACFKAYPEFQELKEIDGGRELIGVFRK